MVKILIADDDVVMLRLLRTLMELEGNEVLTVQRPEDIIPAAERENPRLILMDYHLAGGDALLPLTQLKSDEHLKQIKVLVTSGMDRRRECLEAGAEGFMLKPFRPNQLLERIHEILGTQAH